MAAAAWASCRASSGRLSRICAKLTWYFQAAAPLRKYLSPRLCQTCPHGSQSRGLQIKVDETAKTVSLVGQNKLYDLTSGTQGNRQVLPSGNVFMGWGQQPFYSEFSKTGRLLPTGRPTTTCTRCPSIS